ncbi:MAG: NAD-dependent epimerase/dehydratase family protein [Chloroflexota bacterium]
MKIAVTGAAGFIGSHVAEKLSQIGHEVIGIDGMTSYYARSLKEANAEDVQMSGVRFLEMDLLDDRLGDELADVEIIYHLAAQPGISATTPFEDYVRNNLMTTHHLLEICAKLSKFACFVNIATSSVYGRMATEAEDAMPKPTSYYGVTKTAAEQLVMAYHQDKGLPATSLRLYSVIGPRERPEKLYSKLIRCILEERPFPLFEGSRKHSRSFTYVGDIVNGLVSVLPRLDEVNGEIFNIGSDIEHTTGEGIEMIEDILGMSAQFEILPKRAGDQHRTLANIEKAGRLLGYEPQTTLYDALKDQVDWYKSRIHNKVTF